MWYFQVRYDSRVVIYDHRGFIRLATGLTVQTIQLFNNSDCPLVKEGPLRNNKTEH